jgi:YfiH family protein
MTFGPGAPPPALPALPDSFRWTTEAWGSGLRCRPLEEIAAHVFTTRQLQLTQTRDLHLLAASMGVDDVVMVTQVHKADVVTIRKDHPMVEGRPDADILISDSPEVAIAVRAADCVPILLADRLTGAVGAVHAGWRGTAARAGAMAIEAMGREFGSEPRNVVAAIGPSIGPCCYEVGPELVDAFAASGHERYLIDRWFVTRPSGRAFRGTAPLHLDLAGANRDQLILAGLAAHDVHVSGLCTGMNLDVLTSFRVEREQAGRIAATIVARRL